MKKIILITIILAMLFSITANAQTNVTELTGTIQASILDVDIPTLASFTINPNGPTFSSPDLIISNNSTMPVTLSISGFDNKAGSDNQFIEVGREDKDWDNLGISQSSKYIHIAIGAKNPNEMGYIINREWQNDVSAHDVQAGTIECGSMAPFRNVTLKFTGEYGKAFQQTFTTTYDLMFLVSIME